MLDTKCLNLAYYAVCIIPNVIMLSVVAPEQDRLPRKATKPNSQLNPKRILF